MNFRPYFLLLLTGGLVAVGCKPKTEATATAPFMLSDTMMRRIRLEPAQNQTVRSELTLVGKVVADENRVIKVYPLVGGNVESVKVELGDYVRRGQTLAVLRSGEVADLERQSIQAQSAVLLAEKNLRVVQDLLESKLASQPQVTTAQQEVDKAKAELARIREVFKIYGIGKTASTYLVKAPIDGFVIEKNVNQNMQLRSDNAQNLFTIGQISDVWVLANVNESDIGRVRLGMDAGIQTLSYPDRIFRGKVDKVFSVLDPETKALTVRIKINNTDQKLKPEMHATVTLRYEDSGQATTVPAGAVIFDHSKNYVMVFHDRGHIETREVTLLKSLGDVAYVRTGLKPGERIIAQNQLLVYDALND